MQLTASQTAIIRNSWSQLRHLDLKIAEIFYTHLFEEEPDLRKMFKNSPATQYRKLVDTLHFVVEHLDKPSLDAAVSALAIRHVGYGVKNWHYEAVGEALIYTLRTGMGNKWTMEMSQAWESCYEKLASAMTDAAASNDAAE